MRAKKMIKPDHKQAARDIQRLHAALEGVLMCCQNTSNAYDLAFTVRDKLRNILRLMGDVIKDEDDE